MNWIQNLLFEKDQQQDPNTAPVSAVEGVIPKSTAEPPKVIPSMVDSFIEKLQTLMKENNQEGFDFLEFTESLFENSNNPGKQEYVLIFNIAKKAQPALSVDFLLKSSQAYKNLIETGATEVCREGEQKRQSLIQMRDTSRSTLNQDITTLEQKVIALQKELESCKTAIKAKTDQLNSLDAEYEPQLADINSKIESINTAKGQIISSIVDVEIGIKNHLETTTNLKN